MGKCFPLSHSFLDESQEKNKQKQEEERLQQHHNNINGQREHLSYVSLVTVEMSFDLFQYTNIPDPTLFKVQEGDPQIQSWTPPSRSLPPRGREIL